MTFKCSFACIGKLDPGVGIISIHIGFPGVAAVSAGISQRLFHPFNEDQKMPWDQQIRLLADGGPQCESLHSSRGSQRMVNRMG